MSNDKQRYAMALVIEHDPEAADPESETSLWEDVSATLGDGNNFLEDGHSLAFLGDPFPIVEKDEYHSGQVAYAVLSGVQRVRGGLPVRVHDGEELRSALDQVQEIATDGTLMLREDGTPRMDVSEYVKAAAAKLERIANIAEAGEPDEDWDGGSISGEELMAEREPDEADPRRDEDNQAALDALQMRTEIPSDVAALIAATFSRDADTVEALDETWEKLRKMFPATLAPEPSEDGMTRIGGAK